MTGTLLPLSYRKTGFGASVVSRAGRKKHHSTVNRRVGPREMQCRECRKKTKQFSYVASRSRDRPRFERRSPFGRKRPALWILRRARTAEDPARRRTQCRKRFRHAAGCAPIEDRRVAKMRQGFQEGGRCPSRKQ